MNVCEFAYLSEMRRLEMAFLAENFQETVKEKSQAIQVKKAEKRLFLCNDAQIGVKLLADG